LGGGGDAAAFVAEPGQVVTAGAGSAGLEPGEGGDRQEVPDAGQHGGPAPQDGGQVRYLGLVGRAVHAGCLADLRGAGHAAGSAGQQAGERGRRVDDDPGGGYQRGLVRSEHQ
jgi:hypothetical protein